jgi:hypothetical protein
MCGTQSWSSWSPLYYANNDKENVARMKEKNAEKTKISLRFQMQGMIQSLRYIPSTDPLSKMLSSHENIRLIV